MFGLATLRGSDLVAWYSTAWFDKQVKCAGDPSCEQDADRRLLTDRWRDDLRSGQIDTNDDPNVYSFYRRSRYDFLTAGGDEVACDDMRTGCASMIPDGLPPGYDLVADAYSPLAGSDSRSAPCALPVTGSAANDTPRTLVPSEAGDAIRGGAGDDRLRGLGGDDCLYGDQGNDRLRGDPDDDRLYGGRGRDRLRGGEGNDRLRSGTGSDRSSGAAAATSSAPAPAGTRSAQDRATTWSSRATARATASAAARDATSSTRTATTALADARSSATGRAPDRCATATAPQARKASGRS